MLSETRFIFLFYNNELVAQAHFGILGPSLRYGKNDLRFCLGRTRACGGPYDATQRFIYWIMMLCKFNKIKIKKNKALKLDVSLCSGKKFVKNDIFCNI